MPRLTLSTGRTYNFLDANPDAAVTLLCIHGFPDSSHGWRDQIGPWAAAGFRVVVPDMLGYGDSDAPMDPAQYTTKRLCADLAALLDALAVPRAVVVGHDWGAYTAARFARWFPARLDALVLISVPYTAPARAPTLLPDVVRRAPNLAYQLFLSSPEAAPLIEANLDRFLHLSFSGTDYTAPGVLRALLTAPTLPADVAQRKSILADRPRTLPRPIPQKRHDRPAQLLPHNASALRGGIGCPPTQPPPSPPTLPVLFLGGTLDPTIAPAALRAQRRFVPNLTEVMLEGRGHWLLVEGNETRSGHGENKEGKNEKVSTLVLEWLARQEIGARVARARM
ncbi:epoxide hydrolase [Mycena rebaudengoi]|nr:epoxide hydrolase [Mycena rebaudengoi]